MKRLLFFLLSFLPFVAMGEEYDKSQVMQIASACLGTDDCSVVKTSRTYCIIQRNDGVGFAIVSLDENRERRLLGYADHSAWDEEKMPAALLGWLQHVDSVGTTYTRGLDAAGEMGRNTTQRVTISPLLTCHWHQNSPYNDLTPVITDGNVKTVAGCVAIAAAQIVYYWRNDNPESTLEDTPVYPYGKAPVTMSVPKGSPNDWSLMKDSYSADDSEASRHAAAQLCYVLGTTSYLNYGSSTGGSINDAANAMYSQYSMLSDYTSKNKHSQEEWEDLIYKELDKGRPVLCAGNPGSGDGHAFVLDGYDSAYGLYHFNFGWGGSGDGYYPIDDSEDAMGGYCKSQSIVYDIRPKKRNIEAALSVQKSEAEGKIDVVIDITNKSTLDIKCLKLYLLPNGKTVSDADAPVWLYEETIENDGTGRQVTAHGISPLAEHEYVFCLTDENAYVIGNWQVDLESGIKTAGADDAGRRMVIYDLRGQEVRNPLKGVYIVDDGKTRKKVVLK